MATSTKTSKDTSVELPTLKELLEAGVHFGHETKRWNPKFKPFVYTKRGGFHIIDLEKTLEKLGEALKFLQNVAKDGEVIMVGTKRQARDIIKQEAIRCGAFFVSNRWVGGQITNFEKISKGIKSLREIEEKLSGDISELSQQELSVLRRDWARLDRLYGGIKDQDKLPDAIVVIDAHYEKSAIKEAKEVGIPIVALIDSNSSPEGIDYPVPANDDAIKSIALFAKYFADAILAGNKGKGVVHKFVDLSHVGIKDVKSDVEKSQRVETQGLKVKKAKKVAKRKVTKKSVKSRKAKTRSTKKKTTRKLAKAKKTRKAKAKKRK